LVELVEREPGAAEPGKTLGVQAARILSPAAKKPVIALFVLAGAGALHWTLRCENVPRTSIVSPCRTACAPQPQLQRELTQMARRFKNIAHCSKPGILG
jgi:hypothetical protein